MSSAAMAIKNQSQGSHWNAVLNTDKINSLDMESCSANTVQLNEQFASESDCALKVRKPYTITKQRERWTDEEHKRFLEALKLHGRAWRRIEEHVGTKTAVQIRSHAQKFFSKVVRDSNNIDENSLKPIDIPPPRPKRQAVRPYPRKLVTAVKVGIPQQQKILSTPKLSVAEQENQSPKSVLSTVASDTMTDSSTPNRSLSPVSSAEDINLGSCIQSEPVMSVEENGSSLPAQADFNSNPDGQAPMPMKFDLFPKRDAFTEGGVKEELSSQCLKLFGKTLIVKGSHKPSSATTESSETHLDESIDGIPGQAQPSNSMPGTKPTRNAECSWGFQPFTPPVVVCYAPLFEDHNPAEVDSAVPDWTTNGGASRLCNPIPRKVGPSSTVEGASDTEEIRRQGSLTASNTRAANADGNGEVEIESSRPCPDEEKRKKSPFLSGENNRIGSFLQRGGSDKVLKGFLPYKRCLAERNAQSSAFSSEENDDKRICLCL